MFVALWMAFGCLLQDGERIPADVGRVLRSPLIAESCSAISGLASSYATRTL